MTKICVFVQALLNFILLNLHGTGIIFLQLYLSSIQYQVSSIQYPAYSAALIVYQYAKNSRMRTEGLDELVDDMGKLFVRKSAKTDQP
jgi:hypothetical protein